MNMPMIRYILNWILRLQAGLFLLVSLVSVIYHEDIIWYYLGTALACIVLSFLISPRKPQNTVFYLKEGCVATSLSWILMSIMGALPLWLSKEFPSFTDSVFEIVSGLTTTGASVCQNVEALSKTTIFWRSLSHWVGGMGVLVFILAIVPMGGGSHFNLMRAESPGPSVGKLVPKIRQTARILYVIYFGLTVLECILLLFGDMSFFESLNTSLATAGTGGFGFRNSSMADFNAYTQWVITIFMFLFGVNFNFFYFLLLRQFKKSFAMEEVRCYALLALSAITVISLDLWKHTTNLFSNASEIVRHSSFQVATVMTTTGFATTDFDLWPQFSRSVLVLLMFIGACAGSTGGGMKVSRYLIVLKTVRKELNSYIHPKSVKKITFDEKPIDHDVVRSVNVFFITYIVIFVTSVLLVSIEGKSLTTNFTAVAATLNNIGPGLDLVGPTRNYADFTIFSKFILMFDMLAGRLELFPLLILFHPTIWKDSVHQAHVRRRNRRLDAAKEKNNSN